MKKTRVLLISYLFPPAGGITVQRALSLAKYLPENDCEVHVLTARNAASPVFDPDLVRQVPPGVTVHSAYSPEVPFFLRHVIWRRLSQSKTNPPAGSAGPAANRPSWWKALIMGTARRIFCPEPEVLWAPFAIRQARRIVRRHGIDAVIVTAPPFSTFLVGNALKREFPNLTYIADFRDEWLTFYLKDFEFQNSELARRKAAVIERDTIESADRVVAVTESSLREIRRRYPEQADAKFICLGNGYDPAVFEGFTPRRHESPKVVITHSGTVYKTASPKYYLDALESLPEEIRSRLETRFVGRIAESERAAIESRANGIRVLGFVPQAKALAFMEETDYLLLNLANDISVPGKLFEYLATGKPILALSPPEGEVGKLMRATRAGWCVHPEDHRGIQELLLKAATGGLPAPRRDADAIRRYERPRMIAEYARLLKGQRPDAAVNSAVEASVA